MEHNQILKFADELQRNLTENILPYWLGCMTDPRGGFYGQRDGNDTLHPDAPKGAILNARILWTLAAAAAHTGRSDYAEAASRQARYFIDHFIDREHGGVFWSVTSTGKPADTKKQFYAIAFAIYGLAEYVALTGCSEALDEAVQLFRCIESKSRDSEKGGYLEAMTRDWKPITDMRLSEKDLNSEKTMNTHLHILEAYSNLLRVWPSDECRLATASLVELFNDRIVDHKSHHMGLFFDTDMKRVDADISYGHDIEASWLMLEAAMAVGDSNLIDKTRSVTRHLALAALEGRCHEGSMIYERHASGGYDNEKHWWVQAENVVGQIYLAKFHGLESMLEKALESWRYIDAQIVDHENGEWLWSRLPDGTPNRSDDKAGFWKCPYHNSRMCIEGVRQLKSLNRH